MRILPPTIVMHTSPAFAKQVTRWTGIFIGMRCGLYRSIRMMSACLPTSSEPSSSSSDNALAASIVTISSTLPCGRTSGSRMTAVVVHALPHVAEHVVTAVGRRAIRANRHRHAGIDEFRHGATSDDRHDRAWVVHDRGACFDARRDVRGGEIDGM